MVYLLAGPKGTGKTQQMIEQANEAAKKCNGNVVFIKKNHDIECVFIDGILKHADISLDNIPAFIDRLKQVSKECEVEFYVSISANKEELADVNTEGCKYLN